MDLIVNLFIFSLTLIHYGLHFKFVIAKSGVIGIKNREKKLVKLVEV